MFWGGITIALLAMVLGWIAMCWPTTGRTADWLGRQLVVKADSVTFVGITLGETLPAGWSMKGEDWRGHAGADGIWAHFSVRGQIPGEVFVNEEEGKADCIGVYFYDVVSERDPQLKGLYFDVGHIPKFYEQCEGRLTQRIGPPSRTVRHPDEEGYPRETKIWQLPKGAIHLRVYTGNDHHGLCLKVFAENPRDAFVPTTESPVLGIK